MSKEKRRVPKLRFPGFTEDWEQRKLGDFYTFKNGLNKEKVYFGYGDSIVNFTDVFHNRQIYSSTLKGKVFVNKKELENFKVKEGDLFFTRTSETIDEIGFPAVVMEPMERVVFSGFVLRGRAEKNDPLVNIFKSYIFFTDNFRSEMKRKSSMTTRALTSGTALKEMYFSYPKDLEEQTKIGEILLRLDNVITLHQRKLDNLKLKKKALLQKLFPKNGERYPELRFPGFTDAWEQRKFVDLFEYERPDAYIVKSDNYNDNFNTPVLTANKAFILGYTNEKNSYDKPSIIFDDFTLDRKYVDFPYMLKSSAIKILTSKSQHNLRFLFERLNATRFEVLGHARHYISVVQNTTTLCPSFEEEVCISNLLTKFDELLTLHQQEPFLCGNSVNGGVKLC